MFLKRILSSLIDLSVSLIPVIISLNGKGMSEYYFIISFVIYLLHTNISLLIKPQNTIGEKLLKIYVVYTNGPKKWKIILRNILFALLVYGPVIVSKNVSDFIFMSIPLLGLLPLSIDETTGKKINGLDMLFKTSYNNI